MDALPCPNAHGVRDTTHRPPLASLNDNSLRRTTTTLKIRKTLPCLPREYAITHQTFCQITNFIRDNGDDWEEFCNTTTHPSTTVKTKKALPHLPHPLSLNVLPSPVNKWSATSHPIRGLVMGYKGTPISYHHFYFHNDRVLQTKAFAASTTATTVGDGGEPRGSTELDKITGHNCSMSKEDYTLFANVVLRTRKSALHYGEHHSESAFINTLLCDFVCLTNLSAFFRLDENGTKRNIAQILARFSLLMLGAEALTPRIVERVWGSNPIVRWTLGGIREDLALIRRRLISLAVVANNTFHLWLTTSFNGTVIISPEGLVHIPPGIRDILTIVRNAISAIYVREPLHDGQDRIDILLDNLR
jgi:hypothetical protein